jgi:hypothetical protein
MHFKTFALIAQYIKIICQATECTGLLKIRLICFRIGLGQFVKHYMAKEILDIAANKLCGYMELKRVDSTLPYVQAPYLKNLKKLKHPQGTQGKLST